MMAKPRNQNGFTLIELTLALLLLAIITAFGVPSMRQLYEYSEMQRVTSGFANALRYAQQRAIQERVPVRVELDVDENSYWVPVEKKKERRHYTSRRNKRSSSSKRSSRSNRRRVKEINEIVGSLPNGFVFEFFYKVAENEEIRRREGSIYFYPDGSADETFITILWLSDKKEEERRLFIKIAPATGLVTSMEGTTEEQGSDFYEGYYDQYDQYNQ